MTGISISERNPRYWRYDGEPTLLLGGSVEDNLFQVEDFEAGLDSLVSAGGNYVRCTMSSRDDGDHQPFGSSEGVYDLETWNDEYWHRFERFLAATAERDVIVQIELFDCWDCVGEAWAESPWNPANNATYSASESGLPTALDDPEQRFENPFLRTVPALEDNQTVRTYQEAFVDRVLEATADYEHVLYSVENETETDPAWGRYWVEFVTARDPDAHVTQMWNAWELGHPHHFNTIDHPETYDYVEVSQNNFFDGEDHWARLQACRAQVTDPLRPLNNVKIYGSDEATEQAEIFVGTREAIERFWRNVFGGCATARFHRPPYGIGISELARTAIEGARTITDELDLLACEPHNELREGWRHNVGSRAFPTPETEAYVLADPGEEYAVYFPDGGETTLEADLSGLTCRWFDADRAEWGPTESTGGRLAAPDQGQWIALIQ